VAATNRASNDAITPTASISVPTTSWLGIPVTWSGQDDLSGIRHYDVQVRENGGSWTDH
jgi:hypothetical protein